MEERKTYPQTIEFNETLYTCIVIDQHYKEKHPDISDELILGMLELVIHESKHDPESDADENGFQYFRIEPVEFQGKPYRLILMTCKGEDFLGVVNAFRVESKK